MIRQARTYMVGAMGGATLIAVAIAVFVVLVSAQVFKQWPIAGLGDNDSASVSQAQPAGGSDAAATVGAATVGSATGRGVKSAADSGGDGSGAGSQSGDLGSTTGAVPAGGGLGGSGGTPEGGSAAGSTPASPTPGSGGGSGSGGSAGTGGGSGGGSGGGPPAGTTPTSTTGKVAETVNGTVHEVDETVTGGGLEHSGVTEVTEGVVNGVVGPESTVGHVVDETVGALGGLLGGKR